MARSSFTRAALVVAILAFAAGAHAQTFNTFMEALSSTPGTEYGKQIVETLKLQGTLSNPKLALTIFMPDDKSFDAMSSSVGITPETAKRNPGLMKQVMFYHFVTGANGEKRVFPESSLEPGLKLDTMYTSSSSRKPYQLAVAEKDGKLQIKSIGTTANIVKSDIRCGAGHAYLIDTVLSPMPLDQIPRF